MDVKAVSSMLGHYDAGFTLRTYTHATRWKQDEAAQTMGSFMAQVMQAEKEPKNAGEKTKHSLRCSLNLSGHFRVLHHKGLHAVAGTVIPYASLPVTDPPSLSADHFVWMP